MDSMQTDAEQLAQQIVTSNNMAANGMLDGLDCQDVQTSYYKSANLFCNETRLAFKEISILCVCVYPLSLFLTLVAVTFVHRNKIDVPRYNSNGQRINVVNSRGKQRARGLDLNGGAENDPNSHINIQNEDSDSGESINSSDDEFELDENGLPRRKQRSSCCCCCGKSARSSVRKRQSSQVEGQQPLAKDTQRS
jgi:hypothetical protein